MREWWGKKSGRQKLSAVVAVALGSFQIYTSLFGTLDALQQRALHLVLALSLVFLVVDRNGERAEKEIRWLDVALLVCTAAPVAYLMARYDWVTTERFMLVTPVAWYEAVLGIGLILAVLEAVRRIVSRGMLFVVIAFMVYPVVGPYLPGVLRTSPIAWSESLDVYFLSSGGIFGIPLGASATEIGLFILFGAVLLRSGGATLISEVATVFAGRLTGGAAKVAVVGSSLMGTISGSGTANVATVGSVTIGMMKKAGYSANFAAALEAAASTGGQIMPPVMGAAAFVMASFSGIPYSSIIRYALFPAVLYYISLFVTVDVVARRDKLPKLRLDTKLSDTMRFYGHMIIPIAVLITLLGVGYSPRLAGGMGIVTAVLASQLRKSTRLGLTDLLATLEDGARGMLVVASSTAAAGIIVGTMDLTGLGQRLGSAFSTLAGGHLLIGLMLGMIFAMILGLGMPTTPAYIIQAATVIPGLIGMGLPPFVAHLFAFYYACLAIITPPDASAAYAAAAIAGADGWKVGWLATRLALVAFIVPFMFAFNHALLLVGPWWEVTMVVLASSLGVTCLTFAMEGYFLARLSVPERVLATAVALLLMTPSPALLLVGLSAFGLLLLLQMRARTLQAAQPASEPEGAAL